jgi:hypothetical protein
MTRTLIAPAARHESNHAGLRGVLIRSALAAVLATGAVAVTNIAGTSDAQAKGPKPMTCKNVSGRFQVCGKWGGTKLIGFGIRF